MKKPIYKCWWFWVAIVGFIGNITCSIIFMGESGANIFTAISGWVSGIATAIIGAIAFAQNKNYKEENDRFIEYQQQRDWRIEQKELINSYLENIINVLSDIKENQYSKLINTMGLSLQKKEVSANDIIYDEILDCIKNDMIYTTLNTIYYFDGIEDLYVSCCNYTRELRTILKDLSKIFEKREAKPLNQIAKSYKELVFKFNQHIYQVRLFISMIMSNGIYEDIEKILKDKEKQQNDWRKRIKTLDSKEQKNNG